VNSAQTAWTVRERCDNQYSEWHSERSRNDNAKQEGNM